MVVVAVAVVGCGCGEERGKDEGVVEVERKVRKVESKREN